MNIKRLVPDTITSCNLLCGAVAVLMATEGAFLYAFLFILLGAFFDFFDGMSARLLKVPSPLGIQMDSLADDITFGLAPAMMLCCYLRPLIGWWCLIALLMAAASARRLAKFNIDDRQTTSFLGLPVPAHALFWTSILYAVRPWMQAYPVVFAVSAILLACASSQLLVSELPMFSLKIKSLSWKGNELRYLLVGCAILFVVLCGILGIAGTILLYVILSLLNRYCHV